MPPDGRLFVRYFFYLIVNIDGIPVYRSSSTQFWPILCTINSQSPMIIALYVGTSKPTSVNEFLADFVDDVRELQSNGFMVHSDSVVKPVILRGLFVMVLQELHQEH